MIPKPSQAPMLLVGLLCAGLVSSCGPGDGSPDWVGGTGENPGPGSMGAVVVTSDYTDTLLARVDRSDFAVSDQLLAYAEGDVQVFAEEGQLFVVSRTGADVVRQFQGDAITEAPTLEFSTGAGSNPHTVQRCGDRLFVSLYGESAISIRDPATGVELDRVDLSDYDEGDDGSCEPASMVRQDDSLFVALERFDLQSLAGDPVGWIVQIDCESGGVIDSWEAERNPSIQADPHQPGRLLVRTGDFFQMDGSIRVLEPETGTWTETLVTEEDLLRDITGVAATSSALVLAAWNYAAIPQTFDIRCLDRETGAWTQGPTSLSQNIWTLRTSPDGRVWIAALPPYDNPTAEHGILVLDPASCGLDNEGSWIPFSLPPTDMAFP